MILSTHKDIDIIIAKNVFTQKEQEDIWNELHTISNNNIFLPPEKTGSSTYADGSLKKKNSAIFLDELYTSTGRNLSAILNYTQRFFSEEIKNSIQNEKNIFGMMKKANCHATLVNYYENSDYYDFHDDECAFSILSYIFKEPRKFKGGNIVFKENENAKEVEIQVENNMSIIFPSFYQHKVIGLKMEKEDMGKMLGRFSVSQFIYINAVI